MLHIQKTFLFKSFQLHYHQFGTGEKIYFAFHGFGQTGLSYQPIAKALGEDITMYSFDLPFHGKTYWESGEEPLEKAFWRALLIKFSEENKISKFSIIGFSLGGKFALITLELFPEKIQEVILIAPDGIKTNIWYALATYPFFLRRYFKSLILKPSSFFRIVNTMHKLKLMDKGVLRFASSQMDTIEKRRKVYYSWMVLRKLHFDNNTITKISNANKIPFTIYLGTFDKIITVRKINSFFKDLNHGEMKLLKTGHNALLTEVAKDLKMKDYKNNMNS